ncbi:hypothetical protein B0H14DRAFT_2577801 [Mycena olivaceomarginata]|nr:hypothetical protein B0H14DRAFT_2577801 [Mycena olivaceomarginata]
MSTTLVGKIELCSQIIPRLDPLSSSALISTSGPKQLPQLSFPVLTQSPLPSAFKPIPIKTRTSANTEEESHKVVVTRHIKLTSFLHIPPLPPYGAHAPQAAQPRAKSQVMNAMSGNNKLQQRLGVWTRMCSAESKEWRAL